MPAKRATWGWVLLAFLLGLAVLRWVREPAAPERHSSRVLLFAPNLNETAYVLGHGARIAAVTDYCVWPEALLKLPRMGGILNPNLERIAGLDPGLLVLQGENESLRNFARREGIALADVNMDLDLRSVFAGVLRLDTILAGPKSPRGEAVVDSLQRRLDLLRSVPGPADSLTVLLVLGHAPGRLDNLIAVGPGTYLQDLVALVGGVPFPRDGTAYRNLSVEALVARPPDVAIDLRPGAKATEADRENFEAAWRRLSIDTTRVAIVDFDGILIPGPRIDQSASALRDAIFRASRDRP